MISPSNRRSGVDGWTELLLAHNTDGFFATAIIVAHSMLVHRYEIDTIRIAMGPPRFPLGLNHG